MKSVWVLAVAAALVGTTLCSDARAVVGPTTDVLHSGWSGKASYFSESNCFVNSYSAVFSSGCSNSPMWVVPLHPAQSLSYSAYVTAGVGSNGGPGTITCFVAAVPARFPSSSTYYSATQSYTGFTDVTLSFVLPSLNGQFMGLDLYCAMGAGTHLNSVVVTQ